MRTETLLSTQVTTTLLSQSSWPLSGAYLDRVASVASYLLLFLLSKLVQTLRFYHFVFITTTLLLLLGKRGRNAWRHG